MGVKQILINSVLLAIFLTAILSFGVQVASDNNANISIANDPAISRLIVEVDTNVSESTGDLDSATKAIDAADGEQLQISTDVNNPAIPRTKTTVTKNPLAIFVSSFALIGSVLFGGDADFLIIIGWITGILAFIISLYWWKWWRSGDPD